MVMKGTKKKQPKPLSVDQLPKLALSVLDATLPLPTSCVDGGVVKTILLVEDEQTLRTVVLFLLKSSGYNVIAAVDGLDGLRKARECRGEIDALLADIVMPRMTGIELATQLSLDRPKVKILLMSAFATRTIVLQEGWQLLRKPFTLSLLKDKIRVLLQDESEIGHCIENHRHSELEAHGLSR